MTIGIDEFLGRLSALIPQDAPWTHRDQGGRGNFRCEGCVACEDCKFCRDCQQCTACTYCEACEDCQGCTQCRRCMACSDSSYLEDCRSCRASSYLLLCLDCESCLHCLGCVGLQGAEFCVLNEQVTRQAYFAQVRALREAIDGRVAQGWRVGQLAAAKPGPVPQSDPVFDSPAAPPVADREPCADACEDAGSSELSRTDLEAPPVPWHERESTFAEPQVAPTARVQARDREFAPRECSEAVRARADAIEAEAARLAEASSQSFEARLARLEQRRPAGPFDGEGPTQRTRSSRVNKDEAGAGTLPPRGQAARHPALQRRRALAEPGADGSGQGATDFEPRPRALPNARGPASWRGPRADRRGEPRPGVAPHASWVPKSAVADRDEHRPAPKHAPSRTPNRLLAFVKAGAPRPAEPEVQDSAPWLRPKPPARRRK